MVALPKTEYLILKAAMDRIKLERTCPSVTSNFMLVVLDRLWLVCGIGQNLSVKVYWLVVYRLALSLYFLSVNNKYKRLLLTPEGTIDPIKKLFVYADMSNLSMCLFLLTDSETRLRIETPQEVGNCGHIAIVSDKVTLETHSIDIQNEAYCNPLSAIYKKLTRLSGQQPKNISSEDIRWLLKNTTIKLLQSNMSYFIFGEFEWTTFGISIKTELGSCVIDVKRRQCYQENLIHLTNYVERLFND